MTYLCITIMKQIIKRINNMQIIYRFCFFILFDVKGIRTY